MIIDVHQVIGDCHIRFWRESYPVSSFVMEGWYPFGGRGHTSELLNDETIVEIAQNHNVTAAQVILRWNLQRGVVVIPGSSNPDHILENYSIFDFSLNEEDMKNIADINKNQRYENW